MFVSDPQVPVGSWWRRAREGNDIYFFGDKKVKMGNSFLWKTNFYIFVNEFALLLNFVHFPMSDLVLSTDSCHVNISPCTILISFELERTYKQNL